MGFTWGALYHSVGQATALSPSGEVSVTQGSVSSHRRAPNKQISPCLFGLPVCTVHYGPRLRWQLRVLNTTKPPTLYQKNPPFWRKM